MSYQGNTLIPLMLDCNTKDIFTELERLTDFSYEAIRYSWYRFSHCDDDFNEKLGNADSFVEITRLCLERRTDFVCEVLSGEPPENLWVDFSKGVDWKTIDRLVGA